MSVHQRVRAIEGINLTKDRMKTDHILLLAEQELYSKRECNDCDSRNFFCGVGRNINYALRYLYLYSTNTNKTYIMRVRI